MKWLPFILLVAAGATASDCPRGAEGGVVVVVVEEGGQPAADATVTFTAPNWDSTLSQRSDTAGKVAILCVPPGAGYEVTVRKSGYEAAHVTTSAALEPPTVRVVLKPECH